MTTTDLARLDPSQRGNDSRALAAAGQDVSKALEAVMINGDLGQLTPLQRTEYYRATCDSLGLNPLTKPFAYIKLNGKLTLYALRDAADQLRKINGVSIEIVEKKSTDGFISVHVRAKTADGRQDEDLGIVAIKGLSGEAAANAILKAVTKAKRRVTLSICGLGWLDETEVASIPDAQPVDDLFPPQEQDAYIIRLEEEMADMDAAEIKEAWSAHLKNEHRLDADHALKVLRIYEAQKKRIAEARKG